MQISACPHLRLVTLTDSVSSRHLIFCLIKLDVPATYSHKRQPELVTQCCEISSQQQRGSVLIKRPIDDGENLHPSGHQTCPQSCPQPNLVTEVKKTVIQGRGHTSLDFLQDTWSFSEEPLKAHWSIFVAQVRDFRDAEVAPSISDTKGRRIITVLVCLGQLHKVSRTPSTSCCSPRETNISATWSSFVRLASWGRKIKYKRVRLKSEFPHSRSS